MASGYTAISRLPKHNGIGASAEPGPKPPGPPDKPPEPPRKPPPSQEPPKKLPGKKRKKGYYVGGAACLR